MVIIQGVVERITFRNEENDFTVAKLLENGKNDVTTIVGNIISISPGESVELTGTWIKDPKFGYQFKVDTIKSIVPATIKGIEKYLGSGLIKGIGPKFAERIVKQFGINTIDVLDNQPGRLREIEGIGDKRYNIIYNAWIEQNEVKNIMIFLQEHNVSTYYAVKIYKQYKNEAISIVKNNPYKLTYDIFGIGFKTADKIALNIGIAVDSPLRVQALLLYLLNEATNSGHLYLPKAELLDRCTQEISVSLEIINNSILDLLKDDRIFIDRVENDEIVYIKSLYVSEINCARRLKLIRETPSKIKASIDIEKALVWIETTSKIILAKKQKEAVMKGISEKVLVITGGPGTGKTTIIKSINDILEKKGVTINYCAPTGRAAKKLSESTGKEAKTIHRLLEFSPKNNGYGKNQNNPLECDVLVIDEFSMVDTPLFSSLLNALTNDTHLILVGDIDQLPSVGPGNLLKDIVASDCFTIVCLNEIFRQSENSLIIVNAHKINNGEMPFISKKPKDELSDFYFIEQDDPNEVIETIKKLYNEKIPQRFGFNKYEDIQVLVPMQKGQIGTKNINIELQNYVNGNSKEVVRRFNCFRINDKVMQIKNNYDKGVFNGDIGIISDILEDFQEVKVKIDDRLVTYEYSELDELVLAYAVSIHKSQGSEYKAVIIPLLTTHYVMLQRNLIYTGITRAKRLVIIVGTKKALSIAINNNTIYKRYTRLKDRLLSDI